MIFAITGIFTIMLCCLWSRILLVARIIQATADYITDIKKIVVVPIIFITLMLSYTTYWVISGAYIASMGEVEHNPRVPWGSVKWSDETRYFVYYKIFSLLWVLAFLMYSSSFVLISVACIWYFSSSRHHLGSPILKGFLWAWFYHIGTLAFGSLLLAVIWTV